MSNNTQRLNYWTVYKLVSPTDRVYIGCTNLPLVKRWERGSNYRHNKELFNDIVKYGWDSFKKQIVFESECEADARECEHSEIKKYPSGYNIYRGITGYIPTGNLPSQPKQVVCVETEKVYNSLHAAAAETGLSRVKISECCNGKRKRTGGYHWKFVNS